MTRHFLTRERQHHRTARAAHRVRPGGSALECVSGPEDMEIGHHAHGPGLLHRLMRGAVLAEVHRVVREHVDDLLLHQRGEAHRRRM